MWLAAYREGETLEAVVLGADDEEALGDACTAGWCEDEEDEDEDPDDEFFDAIDLFASCAAILSFIASISAGGRAMTKSRAASQLLMMVDK